MADMVGIRWPEDKRSARAFSRSTGIRSGESSTPNRVGRTVDLDSRQPPAGPPRGQPVTVQLPKPVAAFVDAVNTDGTAGFLDCFTPDGVVDDGAAGSPVARRSGPGATGSSSVWRAG
jgi:hypothetical protein